MAAMRNGHEASTPTVGGCWYNVLKTSRKFSFGEFLGIQTDMLSAASGLKKLQVVTAAAFANVLLRQWFRSPIDGDQVRMGLALEVEIHCKHVFLQ